MSDKSNLNSANFRSVQVFFRNIFCCHEYSRVQNTEEFAFSDAFSLDASKPFMLGLLYFRKNIFYLASSFEGVVLGRSKSKGEMKK
jgi:hypothetical protein